MSWDDGGADSNWSNAANWNNGVPGAGDDVFLGTLSSAIGDNTFLDQDISIDSLSLFNGVEVNTTGNFLNVAGNITIANGTILDSQQHRLGANAVSIDAHNIVNNGFVIMNNSLNTLAVPGTGSANAGVFDNRGVLLGNGFLRFGDNLDGVETVQFINSGLLEVSGPGSRTLRIGSTNTPVTLPRKALIDLDGANDDGRVVVGEDDTLDLDLRIRDVFKGTVTLRSGSVFNPRGEWRNAGVVNVDAGNGSQATIRIEGSRFVNESGAQVNVNSGVLVFDTNQQIVGTGAALRILGDGAGLQVNSPTAIQGDLAVSNVDNFTLTVNGNLTINDPEWNWDGAGSSRTTINNGATLEINSNDLEDAPDDRVNGTIEITDGALAANITGGWIFNGDLNFSDSSKAPTVSGTAIQLLSGAIRAESSAPSGFADIHAPITFGSNPSALTNAIGDGAIRFLGGVTFAGGSSHVGSGELNFDSNVTVNGQQTINMPNGEVDIDGADGGNSHAWNINHDLTINAQSVGSGNRVGDTGGSGTSTINLNGSLAKLTVNLTSPTSEWTLGGDGTLNVNGSSTVTTSLAGSDLNVQGRINVNGKTRFTNRVDLEDGAFIDIQGANSELHLQGGSAADPNTISGAAIIGTGLLRIAGSSLAGHGTITTDVEITGGDLIASGGALLLDSQLIAADRLIVNSGALLNFTETLDTANLTAFELAGGNAAGPSDVVNNGVTRGFGRVTATRFINNGTLRATGDALLRISVTSTLDLDGTGISGRVEAVDGDIRIDHAISDPFGGVITVGEGRFIRFMQDWTLGTNGVLNLNGGQGAATVHSDMRATLRGTINVTESASLTNPGGQALIHQDAEVNLPGTASRLILQDATTIAQGATFSGDGRLSNEGTLTLDQGLILDVVLENNGVLNALGPAQAPAYLQGANGTFSVDIGGVDPRAYSNLDVLTDAFLAGTIDVNLVGGFMPSLGDSFTVLTTGVAISGQLTTQPNSLPTLADGLAWFIDQQSNAIVLNVVADGLPGDYNDDRIVNAADYVIWRDGVSPDSTTTGFNLWRANFGNSDATPATAQGLQAIPEPAAALLLGIGSLVLLSRRLRA